MAAHNYLPIITARGGSKGLPGKNIIDLAGKPLIAYTIEAYKKSSLDGECFVSTDSNEIAAISEKYGARVIKRPDEISGDAASSADAVQHAIETLKSSSVFSYTDILLLQPTSPLRDGDDIDSAIGLYEQGKAGSVVSMTAAESHPYKYFKQLDDGSTEPLFGMEYLALPRQELPKVLKQNGAIYIVSIGKFQKSRNFCEAPTVPYIMDTKRSVDIDTMIDLDLVKIILSAR